VFLHDCANAIWSLKGPKGFHLSILVIFFFSKKFKHIAKGVSIFHLKLGSSHKLPNFPPFEDTPPITMADLIASN
jgi:hypothetical protein